MQNNTESSELLLPLDKKKALRERVLAIKDQLPTNWRAILVAKYPQYDKMIYASLLANVVAGRTSDGMITEILEEIANEAASC